MITAAVQVGARAVGTALATRGFTIPPDSHLSLMLDASERGILPTHITKLSILLADQIDSFKVILGNLKESVGIVTNAHTKLTNKYNSVTPDLINLSFPEYINEMLDNEYFIKNTSYTSSELGCGTFSDGCKVMLKPLNGRYVDLVTKYTERLSMHELERVWNSYMTPDADLIPLRSTFRNTSATINDIFTVYIILMNLRTATDFRRSYGITTGSVDNMILLVIDGILNRQTDITKMIDGKVIANSGNNKSSMDCPIFVNTALSDERVRDGTTTIDHLYSSMFMPLKTIESIDTRDVAVQKYNGLRSKYINDGVTVHNSLLKTIYLNLVKDGDGPNVKQYILSMKPTEAVNIPECIKGIYRLRHTDTNFPAFIDGVSMYKDVKGMSAESAIENVIEDFIIEFLLRDVQVNEITE